jgi:hypothetical protein
METRRLEERVVATPLSHQSSGISGMMHIGSGLTVCNQTHIGIVAVS